MRGLPFTVCKYGTDVRWKEIFSKMVDGWRFFQTVLKGLVDTNSENVVVDLTCAAPLGRRGLDVVSAEPNFSFHFNTDEHTVLNSVLKRPAKTRAPHV